MRKLYTFFIITLLNITYATAQGRGSGLVDGDNYYRVRNFGSDRYVYVRDDFDDSDIFRQKADFQAIELWKDASKTIYDPASVILIHRYENGHYNLQAQGTGVLELTGHAVQISNRLSDGTYKVFATEKNTTVYLAEERTTSGNQGKLGTNNEQEKFRKWIVDKIETNSATNYFGIKPTITLNGKYYHPFYAAFPFRTASAGMHVYYVSKVSGNTATLKEIEGNIPASTPVIIECASADPSNNRLELLTSKPAAIKGNKLVGVYFCNGERDWQSVNAYKRFDASTMRVLTPANGQLILSNNETSLLNSQVLEQIEVTDWDSEDEDEIEIACIPANTCYLKADAGTPDVLEIKFEAVGIEDIIANQTEKSVKGVYTLSGTQLRATNDVQGLPAGLYIVGGVKVAIK